MQIYVLGRSEHFLMLVEVVVTNLVTPKRLKSSCVFCGKPGHPARDCRKRPDGLARFKCGQEGHKANVCTNDVPDASANVAAAVPKDSGQEIGLLRDALTH